MEQNGGELGAAVEPPDEGDNGGLHFTQTDPSGRFGRFDHVLGRGAFKVVYKAFDTQEGTEVAWNQVRVSEVMSAKDAENKEERDRLFAEIRVLKALKHKNIMSFYDSWYDPKTYTVNFITELFTSGTLRQYRKRHKHIDEEVVKRWAYQILCGLVYLHGHNPPIIHRDLKCDNIFINGSDGVVKIGDLGLATMLRSRTAPQSVLGTPEFMAPELYEEEYDDRVDVYSFGMCLLELSTMEYPYSECKNAAQIYRKVSLGVRPAGLQKVASGELAEFINVCISPRESRPRARQLLKHSYFDSIRRDKALASSRSEAALAAAAGSGGAGGGDGGSDYGSATSGPVSRTASSLAEMMAAVGSAPGISRGTSDVSAAAQLPPGVVLPPGGVPAVSGPPSVSSSSAHPLSRTVSAEAHSERAGSDSASVRSQRSNASELAMAVLENIAEEGEGTDNGEDAVAAASGLASPAAATGSRQASQGGTPQGSPRLAPSSPAKPGSPTSSDGCRCDATERRFVVKGDWLDLDKRVQLRLRICEPSGTSRTVEFEFDLLVDTATNVAAEMVSDLELTPDDAAVIASTIRAELARLSALPEIHPHASISLAQAAQAFERELTVNALEQAHNSTGSAGGPHHERNGSFGFQLHQHGRFADVDTLGEHHPAALAAAAAAAAVAADVPPPACSPSPLPLPAAVAAAQGVPRPASFEVLSSSSTGSRRPSLEEQRQMVRRPEGSSASLASLSSASSIPLSVGSQPASEPGHALGAPPSLARASPPPRPASTPAAVPAAAAAAPPAPLVAPAPSTTSSGAEGPPTRGLAPPPRPMSPLSSSSGPSLASQSVPVDMPSPSQRVVRSNSVDAMSLLTRTSSMPAGREAVASPLGIGSGALSPSSTGTGILSPSVGVHEKRIPLHQLFANLEDLKASRADTSSPSLEAAMAAAAAAAAGPTPTLAPPSLPPLPQPTGARGIPASSSGSALEGGGGSADLGLLRPRSEACLTMLPRQAYAAMPSLSAPTSAGALAAAVALAESTCPGSVASPSSTCSSAVSPRFAPGAVAAAAASAAAAADAIQRLDLQSSVPVPGAGLPVPGAAKAAALARRSAQVLSAPPSKQPSRDVSPAREGSLSPTRIPAGVAGDATAHLNGKRPPIKDKEALRRQAADAMKAVELRSLNLLEGGLLGKGKDSRGVPMAATGKVGSMGGMASQAAAAAAAAAVAAVAGPPPPGGMGAPMVPPPPKSQQSVAAPPPQMGAAAPHPAMPPPQPQQAPHQPAPAAPIVQPLQPQANGQAAPAPAAAAPASAPQIPKPAVPKLAPPPGQPAMVLPPPPPTS